MRSPEKNDKSSFETELIKHVQEAKTELVSYGGLKQRIRKFCVDNAKTDEERDLMVRGGYMYFFRYMIDQPEVIENIWRMLYEFQEELNEQDNNESDEFVVTTDLSWMLNENTIGLTLNWRLLHSILKGQLEVEKAAYDGEEIYFMKGVETDESKEKKNIKKRNKLSEKYKNHLKEIVKKSKHNQRLLTKPTPGIGAHPAIDKKKEMPVLLKIYQNLQNDADMIYYSVTWRKQIDHFFDVIIRQKIEEIIGKLTTGEWRTERFIPFFQEIMDTYLTPLKQYCADLTEQNTGPDKITSNQLPADMMLEPILIENSYLDEEYNIVPIELVTAKWEVIWEEIGNLLANQSTGTLFRMEIFKEQPSDKIAHDNQRADEAAQLAILTADKVREVSREQPRLWENVQVDINSTAGMEALTEEAAAFYQNKPGSKPLENIGAEPKPDNSELKASNKAELRIKASCLMGEVRNFYSPMAVEELKQKLEAEILPALETDELKREFMLILLEKLSASRAKFEKEHLIDAHIFKAFEDLIRDILNRFIISSGFAADLFIPDQAFIDIVNDKIPNADGYPELTELLRDKGEYQYFINFENRLKTILNENIQQLQIHREMQDGLQAQAYESNWVKNYFKTLKKTVLGYKKEIKRIKGNRLARPFIALGRAISGKGEANKQAKEYCDKLEEAIDIIWEDGIVPTFNNFIALYFCTRNG
jgi:hypothetical protein